MDLGLSQYSCLIYTSSPYAMNHDPAPIRFRLPRLIRAESVFLGLKLPTGTMTVNLLNMNNDPFPNAESLFMALFGIN